MRCPECGGEFDLTLVTYFKAPRSRFACPLCGKRLRGLHTWVYWLWWLVFVASGVALLSPIALRSDWLLLALVSVPWLALGVVIDWQVEARAAVLVPDAQSSVQQAHSADGHERYPDE